MALCRLLSSTGHQRIVAVHTEHALGGPCIAQVLDLLFAVPTSKAAGTVGLVTREDGQVLDLVAAGAAAIGAAVADERAIAKEEEVRIGVEEGSAGIASEAVDVPSVAS
jgi:hypothetical protein